MTITDHGAEVQVVDDKLGLTVHVLSDITVRNSEEICAAILAAWEEKGKPRRMIVDLRGVHHLDSSGVGALMEIQQRTSQANSRMVLCGLEESPRRLLERTGIARLFEIRGGAEDSGILLPASRRRLERPIEDLPKKKRRHRALWAFVWMCVLVGGLAGIGVASYPTLQRYHAQLEQVPVLSGLMGAMDNRVAEVEQGIKDRFGAFESRLTGHIRAERRQQTEMSRRTAELNARLDAVEAAQRATDARINDLQQQLQQQETTKGGPQQ